MIYILPKSREPAILFDAKANYLNTLCEFVLTLMTKSTFNVFSRMSMVASNAFFMHGFSMCIYFCYFPLSSSLVTNTSPKSSLIFLQQNDRCTLLPDFMDWASPIFHGWSFVSYLGDVFFCNDRFLESIRGQCRPQLVPQEQHFSLLYSVCILACSVLTFQPLQNEDCTITWFFQLLGEWPVCWGTSRFLVDFCITYKRKHQNNWCLKSMYTQFFF